MSYRSTFFPFTPFFMIAVEFNGLFFLFFSFFFSQQMMMKVYLGQNCQSIESAQRGNHLKKQMAFFKFRFLYFFSNRVFDSYFYFLSKLIHKNETLEHKEKRFAVVERSRWRRKRKKSFYYLLSIWKKSSHFLSDFNTISLNSHADDFLVKNSFSMKPNNDCKTGVNISE